MAGSDQAEEKELEPSGRKLAEAVSSGNVPRSRDAAHAIVLGAVALSVWQGAGWWSSELDGLVRAALTFGAEIRSDAFPLRERMAEPAWHVAMPALALALIALVAGVIAAAIPGGLHWSAKALKFSPEKLNPLPGFKRIVSPRNLFEQAKLVVIIAAVAMVGWVYVDGILPQLTSLGQHDFVSALPQALELLYTGFMMLVLVPFVVAFIDAPWQWWRHRRELRMSRTEMKEENKQTEGSPEAKAKIKGRMRQAARNRMMSRISTADIVISNPTHFAVALKYDMESMGAPRVIARGKDELALRIRAAAREARVPVLHAPALARALYAHVKLDDEIPRELYSVVARVLGYVWQLRSWVPGRGAPPEEPDRLDVPRSLHVDPEEAARVADDDGDGD